MYQNCLRQQPNSATYIASPSGAATSGPPSMYDRSGYCYPTTSPTNTSSVVYQGSVHCQSNAGHLSDLTSSHCLAARKPPASGLTEASSLAPTSPAGAVYWPHYHQHQRGSYPVAPAGSTPPTTYYDPNRRVMSSEETQWSDVLFGGHSTVSNGQASVEGYSAYRASTEADPGYARLALGAERRGGGGGGGEERLSQQPRQHPSYGLAPHPTSLKAGTAGSRTGPEYQRSIPAGAQRVSAGSSGAVHGHAAPPFDWMRKHAYPTVPSSGKTRTKDKYRIVYTEVQKVELEKEFLFNQYITIQRKSELAVAIGLSDRQVKIWFQNRRAKDRKQKRKRNELHHHQHPTTTSITPSSSSPTKTTTCSSSVCTVPGATTTTTATTTHNNNTSRLSSSSLSSSLGSSSSSSSSSSLVLKQEMMMRCDDAVKLESNFADSIGRSSVASGNSTYDVIPICR